MTSRNAFSKSLRFPAKLSSEATRKVSRPDCPLVRAPMLVQAVEKGVQKSAVYAEESGNPAAQKYVLDRWLCVPTFRWVCLFKNYAGTRK